MSSRRLTPTVGSSAASRAPRRRPGATALALALALLPWGLAGCTPGAGSDAGDDEAPMAAPDTAVAGGGTEATPAPAGGDTSPGDAGAVSDEAPGGQAYVEEVDVMTLESFPLQVRAAISGNLSDGCTHLGEPSVTRDGNTFRVELPTTRAEGMCTQALVPFETTVALPVAGLPKGTYTVDVMGTTGSFTFASDNG